MAYLSELKPGISATVESFSDKDLALKFMEMGLVPGQTVTMVFVSPFGGPVAIEVNGCKISMRYREAMSVKLQQH